MMAIRFRKGEKTMYAMTAIYTAEGALMLFDGHTRMEQFLQSDDDDFQPYRIVSDDVEIADILTEWRIPYGLDELVPGDTFHVYLTADEMGI